MTPMSRVTIHGHDIAYRRAGDGSAILLVHGLAGSSRTWRDVFDGLAAEHTVIAPDLRGHGESDKPAGDYSLGAYASGLRDLLLTLDIDRATIVGQSLGGGIAMQLAYQHPEICERLVLVGSGGLGREVSWILRALAVPGAEFAMPVLFPPFVRTAGDAVTRTLGGWGIRAPRAEEMWSGYASLTDGDTRRAFARTLRAVVDSGGQAVSARDRLYLAHAVPTLLVWGDEDRIIPVAHAYDTHEDMPGSRLEVFEGAGHFPHVEDPARFNEVLLDFLATSPAARPDPAALRRMLRADPLVVDDAASA